MAAPHVIILKREQKQKRIFINAVVNGLRFHWAMWCDAINTKFSPLVTGDGSPRPDTCRHGAFDLFHHLPMSWRVPNANEQTNKPKKAFHFNLVNYCSAESAEKTSCFSNSMCFHSFLAHSFKWHIKQTRKHGWWQRWETLPRCEIV